MTYTYILYIIDVFKIVKNQEILTGTDSVQHCIATICGYTNNKYKMTSKKYKMKNRKFLE